MHALLTLLAIAVALLTEVKAVPHQKRLAESQPWHITNLSIFTATNDSTNNSISFNLVDNNIGLQAETTCSRSALGSVEDANSFYPCANNSFNFGWDGTTLRMQRFYTDTRCEYVYEPQGNDIADCVMKCWIMSSVLCRYGIWQWNTQPHSRVPQ